MKTLGHRRWRLALMFACAVLTAIYVANASWLAPAPRGTASLLAHRGVHQLYSRVNLGRDSCTASRMLPSTNPYLENTIPSMEASFSQGADVLEIDIHPTTDGEFAVFHDWDLDCRTNGHGVTRDHSLAQLQGLDIGWGYTADQGRTFPFRGKGIGMMPSLAEVLQHFPERRFLINIKSRWAGESDLLFAYLRRHDIDIGRQIMVYGHERPITRWQSLTRQGWSFSKASLKACTLDYLRLGWANIVPTSCKGGVIGVPIRWRAFYWGWPNRFLQRMHKAGTHVILLGNVQNDNGAPGMTDPAELEGVPAGFDGIIWTDSIETIGPAWRARLGGRRGPALASPEDR